MKVVSGAPTRIYDVHHARKTGSPTSREAHGDGDPIVVRGRESRLQGKVGQVSQCPVHETGGMRTASDDGLKYQDTGDKFVRICQTSSSLESRMPGNWHVRFGEGYLETCRKVTRWVATPLQRRAGKYSG
jgi:hypothetical protein